MPREHLNTPGEQRTAAFQSTHWSVVLAAGERDTPKAQEALITLCGIYWYPLYAYVRREGHSVDDAQDLTQEFFSRLIEKNYLKSIRREQGKFRSYLLVALKHFLSDQRDFERAKKRGGGRAIISLDLQAAEGRYSHDPMHELTADKVFEKQWAQALMDNVFVRLRDEFVKSGKEEHFDRLKSCLIPDENRIAYSQLSKDLGISETALKVAVHRFRKRYRQLLRETIAETVSASNEIEAEISHLLSVMRS